ncbi:hypothetical protein DQ239_13780 [Blastococcus sp. TF02-09]|uniref:hypothetical protein n=1 Tax=Blastococcus sp. TF02-09 TaxID=2250576 RepID=UPI000DE9D95C|nr:hypothetical protein [Blastococcus sp. TF02-9]RBY76604.1 hypothetical protein DQ239_13780 [Blastococcus sp. TF02-9]
MSVGNEAVLEELLGALDDFVHGRLSVEDVQRHLQLSLNVLERDGSSLQDDIRAAEADLEEIRFTMLLDEQRSATVFRLDPLRIATADRLDANDGERRNS